MTRRRSCLAIVAILVFTAAPVACATAQDRGIADFPKLNADTDWPWWRGPNRNGKSLSSSAPTTFAETDAVWKVSVPGRGHASPIVVGERVYLATADERQKIHSVSAFERATGKSAWAVEINKGGFPAKNHPKNTEASPTLACDGERLYGAYYHHDKVEAVAVDLNGKIAWKQLVCPFRPRTFEYGYGPSPILYGDTVIISAEYDGSSFITALDRKSGKPAWKIKRSPMISFSTPMIAHVAGRDQLLISGAMKVSSYDPQNGKLIWAVDGTTAATCGTMVWDGDVVFASGGFPKAETLAVKADGSGQILWQNNQKCYEQSMLAHDGHLYGLTDGGVMFCWRGSDGREMWKERLKGPVSASPVLADGNIYWANELGTLYVFKATPERFDLVAQNQIGNDSFASPAICGGQVFLRVAETSGQGRQEYLYCFGKK